MKNSRVPEKQFVVVEMDAVKRAIERAQSPAKPGDWMENPQNLANIGHALGGMVVLLATLLFTYRWYVVATVEILLTVYVIVKEFWYDLRYETGETLKSSAEDALGYLVGTVIAWGFVGLALVFHTLEFQ